MSKIIVAEMSSAREHPTVHMIRRKIAPLNIEISGTVPDRLNVLISVIDFRYFFGGYIGMFNLARRLAKEGFGVRMIIVDECKYDPSSWREEIKKYPGLEDFFDHVEVVYAFLRSEPITVTTKDIFIATSWWTAHIANYAMKYINSRKFLYFIQEYEPVFYPMGTFAALAQQSYSFPHYALFSTGILRDYFWENRLGVFRKDRQSGEESSVVIENAILKFEVDKARMTRKEKRKVLFYARPEEHAARNMFELGMIALSDAVRGGYFDDTWEFYGIGSIDWAGRRITLYNKTSISLLPKMSLDEYKELLPECDIGLSLMLSPHPSIVPLEMAAAGMLVVTNTFANKTADRLKEISSNIIPAEPTMEGLESALIAAIRQCDNYDLRIKGADIKWNKRWEDTFNSNVTSKIKSFIKYSAANR